MGKNEKTPITVNDQDYFVEDLSDQQQAMVNHISDLDRKISNARFNLDQLAFGREAFVSALTQSLSTEEVSDTEDAEVSAE
jgi:nitrogen fixation/metabolism regulation signal transduction histidine kinase